MACVVALVALGSSCGVGSEQPRDALIVLSPVAGLETESEIVKQLAVIRLTLDAEGGFTGLKAASETEGFQAADTDGDGEQELLLEMPVAGRDDFPVVRVQPGSNEATRIVIRAEGLDGSDVPRAKGFIPARILFEAPGRTIVRVPFYAL